MRKMIRMLIVAMLAGLVVAIMTTLHMNGFVQSLVYIVLIALVVYAIALIMRMDK